VKAGIPAFTGLRPSAEPEETQHRDNDNDETDDINNAVHLTLPATA
jgi:hypothetical protein